MKYIYIGTAANDNDIYEYSSAFARHEIVYVQQKWDYMFCKALEDHLGDDFITISYPPVQTFPSGKRIICRKKKIEGLNGFYLGLINLPIIKQINAIWAIRNIVKTIATEHSDDCICVLTHTVYYQSLKAVNAIRNHHNIKLFSLVPDLPDYLTTEKLNASRVNKWLLNIYKKMAMKEQMNTNGYICFSEQQMEKLNTKLTHIVMEGYASIEVIDEILPATLNTNKTIYMYAGNLKEDSGVAFFARAFHVANLKDSEFWVFGEGQLEKDIREMDYPEVILKGVCSKEEIIAYEKAADCLINPRPIDEEYAKYSFPSKLMEYMATGTPVLTTHIPSLPDDYIDKVILVEKYCVEDFVTKLREIDAGLYNGIGAKAHEFVKLEKNVKYQTERVIKYVSN